MIDLIIFFCFVPCGCPACALDIVLSGGYFTDKINIIILELGNSQGFLCFNGKTAQKQPAFSSVICSDNPAYEEVQEQL